MSVLTKLTARMSSNLVEIATKHYRREESVIVGDASSATIINNKLIEAFRKWSKVFGEQAKYRARQTIGMIDNDSKKKLIKQVQEKLGVKLDLASRRALMVKQSLIRTNVELITNLCDESYSRINTMVNIAMQNGRDVSWLEAQLSKEVGISSRRAKLIARDQCNKATTAMNVARSMDNGFTKAIWMHSHAGKNPRQSHEDADGEVFDLNQGCFIDGEYIFPREKINCRCFYDLVIELEGDNE